MAVITISREHGSGGQEVAKLVCERLGYRYFDKELMTQLGEQLGLSPEQVVDLPEHRHQVQSLVERLFLSTSNPLGDPGGWAIAARLEAQKRISVQTFQSLIHAAHERDNVVIMGRGGQVVLHAAPDVLHVRLVAPVELRARRVQQNEGLTEDAARKRVAERDEASHDYVKRFYSADAADPLLYDLALNMNKLTPATAAELIIKALDCLAAPSAPEPQAAAA
jgi:cytidylate kinase